MPGSNACRGRSRRTQSITISVINLTRASLVSADPQRRVELLTELSMREGLRIYPDGDVPGFDPIPGDQSLAFIEDELQKRLDPRTRIVVSRGIQTGSLRQLQHRRCPRIG